MYHQRFSFSRCIPKAPQCTTKDFHFLGVSYDEKERRYVGPILAIRLQSAQVPTTGQISFTIQETGKVAILCRSGSNTVEVVDAVTIKSQKR